MLITIESAKSIQAVAEELPKAAAAHRLGVLGVHNLRQKMTDKGLKFEKDCLVFEVCNPVQAKKVLESDMSLSTALPCRIAVWEENGKTKLATIKPTALLAQFGQQRLEPVALEVEQAITETMQDAAR